MRFLVDQNLPSALARWLEAEGQRAEHLKDIGLSGADDRAVFDAAIERRAVLITKDADFTQGADGIQVVWVRIGNTTRPHLIKVWEGVWPQVRTALEAGERLVEVTA